MESPDEFTSGIAVDIFSFDGTEESLSRHRHLATILFFSFDI